MTNLDAQPHRRYGLGRRSAVIAFAPYVGWNEIVLCWVQTPMNRSDVIDPETKSRGAIPRNAMWSNI
jgi:hypothetical protein